jgi:hypothetical protein
VLFQLKVRHRLAVGDRRKSVDARFFGHAGGQRDVDANKIMECSLQLQISQSSAANPTLGFEDALLFGLQPGTGRFQKLISVGCVDVGRVLGRHLMISHAIENANPFLNIGFAKLLWEFFQVKTRFGAAPLMAVVAIRLKEFQNIGRGLIRIGSRRAQ